MDATWLPGLKLVHVVAVIVFIAAHIVSMVVAFRLKPATDRATVRRLLDISLKAVLVAYIALVVVLVAGILAGIAGAWFTSGRLWIWVSLVVLVVVAMVMFPLGTRPMMKMRWASGARLPWNPNKVAKEFGAAAPTEADYTAVMAAWNPWIPLAIGLTALVVLFWLMLAKPF